MRQTTVRVAAGQGFWGDWLEAPVRQVQDGPIDYLMMDYLAEVTMSIMQKQKSRDAKAGYARDFVPLMERILPEIVRKRIRVTSNAGGVNPRGCADAVLEVARRIGLANKLSVGLVTGDDILGRLDELIAAGHTLDNMETGRPLADIRDQVLSANTYLGMAPIVEALRGGADVVIAGRVTDTGLTLGPIFHEFGWPVDDWDKVAAGTVAGHIIECGAQCSGGNLLKDWRSVKGLENPGFPIVEVGPDRVRVSGIHGSPQTPMLKVSIAYFYGYKSVGTLVYSWPDAYDKARAADRILRQRLEDLGLEYEQILTEFVGANATHGKLSGPPDPDAPEVQLRIGVRARERASVERFTREIAPLVLTGPPSVTGFAGGRPAVEEVVAYWPALIDRRQIEPF